MYKVEIITGNLSISNFNGYTIHQSVRQLANSAVFYATDKDYKDLLKLKQSLQKGDIATVKINDKTVLSGFVAQPECGYLSHKPYFQVKINSFASRLVGSSPASGQYVFNLSAPDIIKHLIAGFDIEFINKSTKQLIFPEFCFSSTDLIDDVLTKLARLTNTFIYSDNHGRLVMEDKCQDHLSQSLLKTGENIIDLLKSDNDYNGYGRYVLQSQNPINDNLPIDAIVYPQLEREGKIQSRRYCRSAEYITPYSLDAVVDELSCQNFDLTVTGSSFLTTEDKPYQLNTPLRISDNWADVDDDFLIADICFSKNEQGCRAKLNLEKIL